MRLPVRIAKKLTEWNVKGFDKYTLIDSPSIDGESIDPEDRWVIFQDTTTGRVYGFYGWWSDWHVDALWPWNKKPEPKTIECEEFIVETRTVLVRKK